MEFSATEGRLQPKVPGIWMGLAQQLCMPRSGRQARRARSRTRTRNTALARCAPASRDRTRGNRRTRLDVAGTTSRRNCASRPADGPASPARARSRSAAIGVMHLLSGASPATASSFVSDLVESLHVGVADRGHLGGTYRPLAVGVDDASLRRRVQHGLQPVKEPSLPQPVTSHDPYPSSGRLLNVRTARDEKVDSASE